MTNEAATKTKPSLESRLCAAMGGCDIKAASARLVALGYVDVCGRCAGSGRHSFNQIDGDRCYGCNGCGKVVRKLSVKLINFIETIYRRFERLILSMDDSPQRIIKWFLLGFDA